jgi:hypothetical protein
MAGVTVDSGPLSPTYRFADVPKKRWRQLVSEKRNFLATNIKYDCRCLIEFCEEAELVWQDLGFESAADMIRNGYELDPQQIDLAVAWLKINEPTAAVGIDDISKKIADAKAEPLATKPGKPVGSKGGNQHTVANVDNVNKSKPSTGGNETSYTLRRLARDNPEMLDRIESGELSVNAAAIAAGIRKKPTPAEICVKAFRKAENRMEALRLITSELEPFEAAIVRDWITERLN